MENQNISMDEVSAEVRSLLLTYPTLFTNRLDCLINIFTTTNYVWTADGRMIHDGPIERRETMSYDDLDEREARNLAHIKEGPSYMIGLTQIRAYEIARQRMERALIEEHISAVSSQMPSDKSISHSMLSVMRISSDCLPRHMLGGTPFGSIHADWLKAAEQFIDALRYNFNRLFHLHLDADRCEEENSSTQFERMPMNFQELYLEIERIDNLLNQQSGRRERARAALEMIKEGNGA